MNKYSFYANLSACIFVNNEDFDFIFKCAEHHYDTNVKMTTQPGGTLYGEKNRRTKFYPEQVITDEHRIIQLNPRELQLIIKSIEFSGNEKSIAIYGRMYSILMEMSAKQNEINKTLE